jgi:hypothetical protein
MLKLCSKNLHQLQVIYQDVGFEVLTVVVMKSSACCLLYAGFFFGLFTGHEDGGDKFLQNAG